MSRPSAEWCARFAWLSYFLRWRSQAAAKQESREPQSVASAWVVSLAVAARNNNGIHLFSDSQRGINPELLPLLYFSSNSAAVIPIVCCTEAVRHSRDALNNSNASQEAIEAVCHSL